MSNTKYIEIIDTCFEEKGDRNNSYIVAVSEDDYEPLRKVLDHILSNQEQYDNVWDTMMACIKEHDAELICPNCSLEW